MIRRIAILAALVLLAFGLLSGCDQLGSVNALTGSIYMDWWIPGGMAYHVLVLPSNTTIDPDVPGSVENAVTVAEYHGDFPGNSEDNVWTANYQITDVPEGMYYIFAWIDWEGNETFSTSFDPCGFYQGTQSSQFRPDSANVSVPETGIVDIDVYISIAG